MPDKENKNDWDAQALAFLAGQMDENPSERDQWEKRMTESDEGRAALSRARVVLEAAAGTGDIVLSRTINALLADALGKGASDLHFVPDKNGVVVRARVGGVLREQARLPKMLHQSLVDWWKEKINASVLERQKAQNGTLTLTHKNAEIGLHVVVLPQFWGEAVMVHLVNRSTVRLGLDNLGLRPDQTESLRRLSQLPNGLVVTCGPKASGKTTLLYSLLLEHTSPQSSRERSILTVEDPIETVLPGVGQTAVNRDANFSKADALRNFLRADPDVIYCADLENTETVRLALDAALAGSLVLSVVPGAASAWDAFARLQNMGIENFLLAAAVAGLIGQRGVRVFAPNTPTEPDTPHSADLTALGLSPEEDGPFLRAAPNALHHGFTHERAVLLEIVEMSGPLVRAVSSGRVSSDELWALSLGREGGSLRDEAARLVREKRTTAEEGARAIADYPHSFAPVLSTAAQTLSGLPLFGRG